MPQSEVEKIRLQVKALPIEGTGLQKTLELLRAIEMAIGGINNRISGLSTNTLLKRTAAQFQALIPTKGKQSTKKLAELFGFDAKDLQAFGAELEAQSRKTLARLEQRLEQSRAGKSKRAPFTRAEQGLQEKIQEAKAKLLFSSASAESVRSPVKAGQFLEAYSQALLKQAGLNRNLLQNLFGGKVPATMAPGELAALVQSLRTAGNTPGRDPVTGQFTGTGETGSSRRKKEVGPLTDAGKVPSSSAEIARTITETEKHARTVVTEATAVGETLSTTYDELNNVLKKTISKKSGQALIKTLQEKRAFELDTFKRDKLGLAKGDFLGLAALQDKAADQLEALLTDELKEALGAKKMDSVQRKIQSQAQTLRAQATQNRRKAGETRRAFDVQVARETVPVEQFYRDIEATRLAREAEAEKQVGHVSRLHARQRRTLAKAMQQATPPVIEPTPSPLAGALTAFTPMGFAKNLLKVSGWAAAVGALYGTLDLARRAMQSMMETGLETARLSQVFHGVGGSATQLTQDVLRLAAAEGRTRQEAMESAIAWSRLGLTRAQVNEAVRVSLMAANVAELDAAEATEKLQAVMAAYQLRVGELASVLGGLNSISNTFNVTNKDLLEGLSRTASVAKQAGLPLFELMGIIGATVGTTGQTGANIGNAVKSVIVALSNPELQKILRSEFKIEVTKGGGRDIKSMSDILAELFVKYQKLTDAERQNLLVKIAGKTQASRLTAVLDSYVQAQVLAINAQLNLNSAEEEDAKIKATLISRMKGLGSEFARLLADFDQQFKVTERLADFAEGLRNILILADKLSARNLFRVVSALPGFKQLSDAGGLLGGSPWKEFNRLMERFGGGVSTTMRQAAGFNEELERSAKAAQAAQEGIKLLDTARRSLLSRANAPALIEQISRVGLLENPAQFQSDLTAAVQNKDQAAIGQVLDTQAAKFQQRLAQEKIRYQQAFKTAEASLKSTMEAQDNSDQGRKNKEQLKRALDELHGKQKQFRPLIEDTTDAAEQFQRTSLATLSILEHQKIVLSAIADLSKQMPGVTASDRLRNDILGLQAQERFLRDQYRTVERDPFASTELRTKTEDALKQVQAELAAKRSPMMAVLAGQLDRLQFVREIAKSEGEAFDYGETPVQRLKNREAGLRQLITLKEQIARRATDEMDRQNALISADEHRAELKQLLLEKEKQRFEVIKQEYEFQRKLLTAGPAEMLRRIVAERIASRPTISAGQFMSLSPDLRQDVLEARQMNEARQFRQQTPPLGNVLRQWLGGLQTQADTLSRLRSSGAGPHPHVVVAGAAAVELKNLRDSASGASAALAVTGQALQAFREDLAITAQALRSELKSLVASSNLGNGAAAPFLAQAHG